MYRTKKEVDSHTVGNLVEKDIKQVSNQVLWFPRDYGQFMDALWRLTCLALAVWAFTHTQPPFISFSLLGASQSRNISQRLAATLKSLPR